MKEYTCAKCGGFVGEQGKTYSYAGQWCHCTNPMTTTPKAKKREVLKQHHGQVHCIAQCIDCGWNDEGMNTAARSGTKHCRETGHRVQIERGVTYSLTAI
jgi:hypothetical protein